MTDSSGVGDPTQSGDGDFTLSNVVLYLPEMNFTIPAFSGVPASAITWKSAFLARASRLEVPKISSANSTYTATGTFFSGPSGDAIPFTPTINDIYKEIVVQQAEAQEQYASLFAQVQTILTRTDSIDRKVSLDLDFLQTDKLPMLTFDDNVEIQKTLDFSVPVSKIIGVGTSYAMLLFGFSLIIWAWSGFILINPAASIMMFASSLMIKIMSKIIFKKSLTDL